MRRALAVAALAALAAACEAQPDALVERFDWQPAVTGLDQAVLAACGGRGAVHAVGGKDRALLLRHEAGAWTATAPAAGVLWWCWGDDDELALVGDGPTALRAAGDSLVADPLPAAADGATLYGVWGRGDGSLIAVGGSPNLPDSRPVALHFDGSAWRAGDTAALPAGILFKVWGDGAGTVWAVGSRGLIARFDGRSWQPSPAPTDADLIAVIGAAGEVFAVGGLGQGLVLRHAGAGWERFATAPAELAAVWTAPDRALYVGGDRGYVARFDRRGGAVEREPSETSLAPDLCVHGLHGFGDTVVAAASDLLGGGAHGWRGSLYSHGVELGGTLRPLDAGPPDAGSPDAAVADTGGGAGPGETCGNASPCRAGLTCWYLQRSAEALCTRGCDSAAGCASDFGAGACCERPGAQTVETVCIPGDAAECRAPL